MDFTTDALGSVIRERREEQGLTQDGLGVAAGYGGGAGVSVSRVEAGLTRPGPEKFAGIAAALGLSPAELEAQAVTRTHQMAGPAAPAEIRSAVGEARLKDRIRRVQEEVERRTTSLTRLCDEFNRAHDRARDEFFMPFVESAGKIQGAPQPDQHMLEPAGTASPEEEATSQLRLTSKGVAQTLAGGAGGAVAGAAVGAAAAYATFTAAVYFGRASTGTAISSLSGVAATNAALALLGGGTLAAGGAGIAGGTMVLGGIVAGPAVVLALGGLVWMAKRTRKQQKELSDQLAAAEAQIAATRTGVEALERFLPTATTTLDYIAVHAGHALERWKRDLGDGQIEWSSLSADTHDRYQDFVDIAASQLAVVTINAQSLLTAAEEDCARLIDLTGEVLQQAKTKVEAVV